MKLNVENWRQDILKKYWRHELKKRIILYYIYLKKKLNFFVSIIVMIVEKSIY